MLRRVLMGLLGLWCLLGAVATAGALTGPSAWWNRSDAGVQQVVGLPLNGAAETTAIRALLPDTAHPGEHWVVLFPPASDQLVLTYVRYQLAHLEYPRRVDVVASKSVPHGVPYDGVITAPGMQLPRPWTMVRERGGFISYAGAGT